MRVAVRRERPRLAPCVGIAAALTFSISLSVAAQFSVGMKPNWGPWTAIKSAPLNAKGQPSVEVSFIGTKPDKYGRTIWRRYRNTSGSAIKGTALITWIGSSLSHPEGDLVELKPGEMKSDMGWWSIASNVANVRFEESKPDPKYASRSVPGGTATTDPRTTVFTANPGAAIRDPDVRRSFENQAADLRRQAADADERSPEVAKYLRTFAAYYECRADAARGLARTCREPGDGPGEVLPGLGKKALPDSATHAATPGCTVPSPADGPIAPSVAHDEYTIHVLEFNSLGCDGERVGRTIWTGNGVTYCSETITGPYPSPERPCVLPDGSHPYAFGRHTTVDGAPPGLDKVLEFGARDQNNRLVDRITWDDGGKTYCSQTPAQQVDPQGPCIYPSGARPYAFRAHDTHDHAALTIEGHSDEEVLKAARVDFVKLHGPISTAAVVARGNLQRAAQLAGPGADWADIKRRVVAALDIYASMSSVYPNDSYTSGVQGTMSQLLPKIRAACAADVVRKYGAATPTVICNF